jgi:hypothetical protein
MLHMAAKVAWPDYPEAIGPRFMGDELFRCYQPRRWRGTESPDHFLGCIGIKSARVGVFYIHRRKCHLAGAFAPSSWMVWQDLRMKREDAAIDWYWTPWITSWLLVETIRLPVLPRSGPVYKTGASAARPSRKSGGTRAARTNPQVCRRPQDFTIKNEHHYELLCSRTRRCFTADVSVFQAHLPCDP